MNQFKITSFHQNYLQNFVKKLKSIYGREIKQTGVKIIKKRNTILKSPHVNKKARDQIEIKHISYFFKTKNLFFLLHWKKYNNMSLKLAYKHFYSQKLFYII